MTRAAKPRRAPQIPQASIARAVPGEERTRSAVVPGFLLLLCAAALFTACQRQPQRLIRLGDLIEAPKGGMVELPAGGVVDGRGRVIRVGLSAARVARVTVVARGDGRLATLSWRLGQDSRFQPYRTLSFPLVPDGREHSYEVDLGREPYWTGRVVALRLAVEGGSAELVGLSGRAAGDPYRLMCLEGECLPALPGLSSPVAIDLPGDLPRGARFEARVGLVPEFDREGVVATFRASVEQGGGRRAWFETRVAGGGARRMGWRRVAEELPAAARAGGRVVLEVDARRGGRALPEGVALWGDPVIVAGGRRAGPHVVVVLIDTLRADVVGAYGDRTGLTPNLDRLAGEGVRFADLSAPSPWTLPSVATLMTGLEPQTHGAGRRFGEFAPTGLPAGARTLAETLRGAGFYNLGVYHNIYVTPAFGLQQGFDEYVSREERAEALVTEALARLRRYGDERRLFIYLHLFDPHNPYEPPAADCARVARRLLPAYRGPLGCAADRRPENPIPAPRDRRWHEALYRAEVAATDRAVGRFLAGLEDLGMAEDTVLLVLSDHGEEFWTRLPQERAAGYEPNADHGHTHYQELLQVPGILRAPGLSPRLIETPVRIADLFPTLLRLAGVEPPPSQGQDLSAALAGRPLPRPPLISDVILHGPDRWSARRGPWKLIVPRAVDPKGPSGPAFPVELYHLGEDPAETTNRAAADPQLTATLRAWAERELAARAAARRRYLAGDESLGATYLEWNHITKLRSLGYLR
jgi:arylsulfatase A-like enzyme